MLVAAQLRSRERLGSEGLAVAASGASAGKENADNQITAFMPAVAECSRHMKPGNDQLGKGRYCIMHLYRGKMRCRNPWY